MTKEEKTILIVCNIDFIYDELDKLTITSIDSLIWCTRKRKYIFI